MIYIHRLRVFNVDYSDKNRGSLISLTYRRRFRFEPGSAPLNYSKFMYVKNLIYNLAI